MTTALHSSVSRSDSHPPGEVADFLDAADQPGDPAAPASGKHRIYAKAGGVYIEDDASAVVGPLGTGATFDTTPATDSAPGDAADPGVAVIVSRLDHVHGREDWGAAGDIGTETFGATAAAGASGKVADAAHVHPMPADPTGKALGLTGAVAATRYVGATASGAPVAGTFLVGDFCVDQSGSAWVCTGAGTPGTWAEMAGAGGGSLATLSDVDLTGLADTNVLQYDSGSSLWKPGAAAGVADIVDLPTAETDTTKRLAPDGAGGVEFVTGGGSGTPATNAAALITAYNLFR